MTERVRRIAPVDRWRCTQTDHDDDHVEWIMLFEAASDASDVVDTAASTIRTARCWRLLRCRRRRADGAVTGDGPSRRRAVVCQSG